MNAGTKDEMSADDVKAAIAGAAEQVGMRMLTPEETEEFMQGIPSLEQQEENRQAEGGRLGRIILKEGEAETTAHIEEWFQRARHMTLEQLPAFLEELQTRFQHDYGTICHATTAAAIAAVWAMDGGPQGGISGFQAGAVMWGFIRRWDGREGAMRLIRYDDMLYPQHADRFSQTIPADAWADMQKKAAELLTRNPDAHPDVVRHWLSIVAGIVPFGHSVRVGE